MENKGPRQHQGGAAEQLEATRAQGQALCEKRKLQQAARSSLGAALSCLLPTELQSCTHTQHTLAGVITGDTKL